jgi:hypothetical protein
LQGPIVKNNEFTMPVRECLKFRIKTKKRLRISMNTFDDCA